MASQPPCVRPGLTADEVYQKHGSVPNPGTKLVIVASRARLHNTVIRHPDAIPGNIVTVLNARTVESSSLFIEALLQAGSIPHDVLYFPGSFLSYLSATSEHQPTCASKATLPPRNNDGRNTCYWCGAPTKQVELGLLTSKIGNVCTECGG